MMRNFGLVLDGFAVLTVCCAVLQGCGGSSDTARSQIDGVLRSQRGQNLGGVAITAEAVVAADGTPLSDTDGDVTATDGTFALSLPHLPGRFDLAGAGTSTTFVANILAVPRAAVHAFVTLQYDTETGQLTQVQASFSDAQGNQITATRTPGPTDGPTKKPTTGPTMHPIATLRPTTAATRRPTITPIPTPTMNPAIARGRDIFNTQCVSCHSAASKKGATASRISRSNMPPGRPLSGSQMSDLVAYLSSI
jgi:mono/diheme cytochrome c family protein